MVLLLAEVGKGFGLGHYRRMQVLNNYLNSRGIVSNLSTLENINSHTLNKCKIIILDLREANKRLVAELISKQKLVISLDDLETRKPTIVSVLSLPYIKTYGPPPNFKGTNYLILNPKLLELKTKNTFDILITFGGEDPNNLTTFVLENFSSLFGNKTCCVFIGKAFTNKREIERICNSKGIEVFDESKSEFYNILASSNTIVTSFGMTVYEALTLGKNILLFNNSEYHHKIFRRSGLEKSNRVKEIGYLRQGRWIKVADREFLTSPESKKNLEIDVTGNLERWLEIIERVAKINDVDFNFISHSRAYYRDQNKTVFLKGNNVLELPF
ncbi:MAG: hypothetical protein ABDH28_03300 [Brevinematia bacterium]